MKKKILSILFVFTIFVTPALFSQTAPPPPDPGSTGSQSASGGGAPIGGGLFILLGLGAAYAGKKLYEYRKRKPEI